MRATLIKKKKKKDEQFHGQDTIFQEALSDFIPRQDMDMITTHRQQDDKMFF